MSSCSNMPFVARVVVLLLADFTPRALTQLWELVMWTMTSSVPVAMEMTSAMSSPIFSCSCNRLQHISAMRGILDKPMTRPRGI